MARETVSSSTVQAALAEAACPVAPDAAARLAEFLGLLRRWNRVFNLTGIRAPGELIERHLVESLALAPLISGDSIADVGSGAGFPGVPLAVVEPRRRFSLIESRAKRCRFLRQAAAELGLANVVVLESRAEDVDAAEPFDTIVARAVAKPAELVGICGPLLRPGGRLLVLTSAEVARRFETAAPDYTPLPVPDGPPIPSTVVALERSAERT